MKKILFLFLAIVILSNSSAQSQKGQDIDGEAISDQSGQSISMPDANTLAIGARNNNGNGTGSGQVRVYRWFNNSWVQKGQDIDGENAFDGSGFAVSMPDSNTVAIGSINNSDNGLNSGHVRVFSWNGINWVQKGQDIDGEFSGDNSGYSVSMPDANTVAIGATGNSDFAVDAGHVRIYEWNNNDWIQKGQDIDGEALGEESGFVVSMPNPNMVAIGAPLNNDNGFEAGQVRVYSFNGTSWQQLGQDINGESSGDQSGRSISMPDAFTLAIGAFYNSGSALRAGHARIYTWDGNLWVQKGQDIDGEAAEDRSGSAVSMPDSNTIAIGAVGNDDNGISSGQARVYSWNGSSWLQIGQDIDGEAAGDQCGNAISMSDASTLAVAARNNDGNGDNSGHVRVFCLPTFSTISITSCNSYNSPSGNYTWNSSNTYFDTISNSVGCDSIITISLTILNSSSSAISPVVCGSYTSPSGNYTWTASGNYSDTLVNALGCDSIISINLSINNNTSSTISPSACSSYTSPSGVYSWSNSGTYSDTITNSSGCDSIITINLTIDTLNLSLSQAGATLSADQAGASYQWLSCPTYTIIPTAELQSYTATSNGDYAVIISNGSCIDTSLCYNISGLGILENSFGNEFVVYPNPTLGQLSIDLGESYIEVKAQLRDLSGRLLSESSFAESRFLKLDITETSGVYLLQIQAGDKAAIVRIVKK
ncbi:MAG: T9SS type A sorting domain-containing protein [Chitinophagales bacterium]|nr:T9SS type A sorting domain-containing protein [Chitinophagales bacterium]